MFLAPHEAPGRLRFVFRLYNISDTGEIPSTETREIELSLRMEPGGYKAEALVRIADALSLLERRGELYQVQLKGQGRYAHVTRGGYLRALSRGTQELSRFLRDEGPR